METVALKGDVRTSCGTGSARALRRQGMIPAIVYGRGHANMAISVEEKEITKLYRKGGFTARVVELNIDGRVFKVIPKAVALHPVTDLAEHADFIFVASSGMQKVDVPLSFQGRDRCIGIKRGGFLNVIRRKVALMCPYDMVPSAVTVDISEMRVGDSIKASMLQLPQGCQLVEKRDFAVASMTGKAGKDKE